MNWITENPFNILGVLAGVSEKDLAKRKAQINAYLSVGKAVTFPEDLPAAIADTVRTPTNVASAFSMLDQYRDRALHGLFWFCDGGRVDGPAIAHLRAGNIDKAKDIWSRVINAGPLTSQTLSSATNHGALCFLEAGIRSDAAAALYIEGLQSYLKAFVHEGFRDHLARIGDESVVKNMPELLGKWVDQFRKGVAQTIKVDEGLLNKVGSEIRNLPKEVGSVFISAFAGQHNGEVEKMVALCGEKRKAAPARALDPGGSLLMNAVNHLRSLKALLGSGSIDYQHASDLVAEELLQCAIDHYNRNNEGGDVDWPKLMTLMNGAVAHAQGHRLKARVKENKETLDDNYNNREERERLQKVNPYLGQIQSALQETDRQTSGVHSGLLYQRDIFGMNDEAVSKSEALLNRCEPALKRIQQALGKSDELYLNVSSAVANKALQLGIAAVNENMPRAQLNLEGMRAVISRVVQIMARVEALDMVPELRKNVETNARTLNSISGKLRSATSRSNNSGCMVTFVAIGVILTLATILLH